MPVEKCALGAAALHNLRFRHIGKVCRTHTHITCLANNIFCHIFDMELPRPLLTSKNQIEILNYDLVCSLCSQKRIKEWAGLAA